MPAFDACGKFIKIQELETSLKGSLVLVYFELRHYSIKDKRSNSTAGNTFSAIATQVKVLERGTERQPSPYKSRMMKGPTVLPQSPSKRKDQMNAVNAFHPGNETTILLPPLQKHSPPSSLQPQPLIHLQTPLSRCPTPPPRKRTGKKEPPMTTES